MSENGCSFSPMYFHLSLFKLTERWYRWNSQKQPTWWNYYFISLLLAIIIIVVYYYIEVKIIPTLSLSFIYLLYCFSNTWYYTTGTEQQQQTQKENKK